MACQAEEFERGDREMGFVFNSGQYDDSSVATIAYLVNVSPP